ncbi:delta-class carbonic anhydrase [Pseudooceanicola sp. MF1-13]|uniref:delta-class carbonic anhydrase n=1 Tax=Pseudooceanicola sp. MF1-13 TaxID=3379095 RepID=UPI0038916B69
MTPARRPLTPVFMFCAALVASSLPALAAEPATTATPAAVPAATPVAEGTLCQGFGPQTPRDISNVLGKNTVKFPVAPAPDQMNLCNIHMHTNAEHRGPGFMTASVSDQGGFICNDSDKVTPSELEDPAFGHGTFDGVKPGDTIEVHWVYSSCDVDPGPGLGSCLSDACANPTLRVESQVFLVVNDPYALDFMAYTYGGNTVEGHPQPRALPLDTGTPVVFPGSTTGPSYSQSTCSPLQVTWSVRPKCARVDITSIYEWSLAGNVFDEDHSHGVRELVTAPELLAPIR